MFPQSKPPHYHQMLNAALVRAVPGDAQVILDVGCGAGTHGTALKKLAPGRTVYGVELDPGAAAKAQGALDRVFVADVETWDVPLEPGSVDCVVYGDVLEHLRDPEAALVRHRPLLRPGGSVVCSIPNVQNHEVLTHLLRGDFPYAPAGILDATHLRFFTRASFTKLLLDAGYVSAVSEEVSGAPLAPSLAGALAPVLARLGVHPEAAARNLSAYQYVFHGLPLSDPPRRVEPMTVVCCASDESVLRADLLSSPDLGRGTPHEVLVASRCTSAAEGLNACLGRARHRLVVAVHQDAYLPRGWFARAAAAMERAEAAFGPVGVAGVYGVIGSGASARRVGRVIDRERLRWERGPLPARVDTLDELALIVPRDGGLRFDPRLGFHFYGADACLEARRRGLAAVAVDALCFHNSRAVGQPASFGTSAAAFAVKWANELPVSTPHAHVGAQGGAVVW